MHTVFIPAIVESFGHEDMLRAHIYPQLLEALG
jgi:hypothetical protein